MVKIGVIFMSFSNPTDHFRNTADFYISKLKNANKTVFYITGTYFFRRWPEFTVGDILWYVLKL